MKEYHDNTHCHHPTFPSEVARIAVALVVCLFLATSVSTTCADEADIPAGPTEQGIEFFEKEVRPLLVKRCHECHSGETDVVQGGLLLDSRQGWAQGGDSGPAIVPGKPDESLLIQAVRHEHASIKMPPRGKLADREISVLVEWVERGAPDPRTEGPATRNTLGSIEEFFEQAEEFWAFQPVVSPPVPQVDTPDWVKSPIDAFVLKRLEEEGLRPAPRANKYELLRRATFDLTGLPPTPEEIQDFVEDDSPDAFARVVDRLLASPHYGERWGRHWLDLARYADTNGSDENKAYANAWRYRDYVIRAFNSDKPYDRFLHEQLAGDLLPEPESEEARRDKIVATGFLVLGPKMLAEQDKEKLVIDIVDEQMDVVSKTFLGLTVSCARCHDHKFDPVTAEDYYALAGIFKSTRTMENLDFVSKWMERELPSREVDAEIARYEAETQPVIDAKKQQIQTLIEEANERLKKEHEELPDNPEEQYSDETKEALKSLRDEVAKLEGRRPTYPVAMAVTEGEPQNVPVHLRGNHLSLANEETPRGVLSVLSDWVEFPAIPDSQSGRLQLADWLTDPDHPLTSRVMVNRIWQGHFGEGLVGSLSNFGYRGDEPTHPQLLDWLAWEFIEQEWSIKQMHRTILLSQTYQMSTAYNAGSAAVDPENRLLWRQNRVRLEAEPIRDALLAVSGNLDRTMGGSLLKSPNNEYSRERSDDPLFESTRRAVYLPILRSKDYDMFSIFDYANSTVHLEKRPTTTVAHQALFMMNSPLVNQQAQTLAEQLVSAGKSDRERIDTLYLRVYGRPAGEPEVARLLEFLERLDRMEPAEADDAEAARVAVWTDVCQALLAGNEFIYIK